MSAETSTAPDGWDWFFALLHYADLNELDDLEVLRMRREGFITEADLLPLVEERQRRA